MDYKVILTKSFIRDLAGIVKYLTKHADAETAARVGDELVEHALELTPNPAIGQLVKKRPGARKTLLYSYCIYYDVNQKTKIVEVLRVRHGARNPKTLRLS